MRNTRTIFIAAVLPLTAGLTNAPGALFYDHFDTGMSSEWVSIRPAQWVADGWMHTLDQGPGRDSGAFVHDGDRTRTDYTVFLVADPLFSMFPYNEQADIYFRARNVGRAEFGFTGDYYRLSLWGPQTMPGPGVAPGVVLWRYKGGRSTELFRDEPGFTSSDPMLICITLNGPRIHLYIDGRSTIDVVDPDPLLYGGIGLGAVWEMETRYDDVVVVPEPAILSLMVFGALPLLRRQRRTRTRHAPATGEEFGE